jgi:membrane protein
MRAPAAVMIRRVLSRPLDWVRRVTAPYIERLVELELFDRSVAIASQAFVAFVPFLVVAAAVLPIGNRGSYADTIVRRFDLHGSSADAVQTVFAKPAEVQSTLSGIGVFLLVISALSFCRAMQRMYEKAWRLAPMGIRHSGNHLLWLVLAAAYATVASTLNTAATEWLGAGGRLAVAAALSVGLWLWTPYILLGRRIPRRSLRATAVMTASGMLLLSAASILYMPRTIAESAARFGPIGIAIALVSWLISAGFVLVIAAAFGAVLADPSTRVGAGTAGGGHRRPLQRQAQ